MLNNLKLLQQGKWEEVKESMLYPLNRWISGHIENLPYTVWVNRNFFNSKPKWLLAFLSCKIKPKFNKYPKPTKFDDKKFDLMSKSLKRVFGWSNRVIRLNKEIVLEKIDDKEFVEGMARKCGWDDKERRLFKLKVEKFKPKKKEKVRGLGEWI